MVPASTGTQQFGLENGLIHPRTPGRFKADGPAGIIELAYAVEGHRVRSMRIKNVASYLAAEDVAIDVPDIGPLAVDVAYGGNYYAIVEPQRAYRGLDDFGVSRSVHPGSRPPGVGGHAETRYGANDRK